MESIEIKELEKGWIFRCIKKATKVFFLDPKILLLFFLMTFLQIFSGYLYLLILVLSIFSISYSIVSKNKTNKNQLFSKHFFETFKTFLITNKILRNFIVVIICITSVSLFFNTTDNETTNKNNISDYLFFIFFISYVLSFLIFKLSLRTALNNYISLKNNIIFSPEIKQYENMFNYYFYNTLNQEINNKNGAIKFTLINSFLIFLFFIIGSFFYYKFFSGNEFFDTAIFIISSFYSFTYICCVVEELIDGKPEKVKQVEFKPATSNV